MDKSGKKDKNLPVDASNEKSNFVFEGVQHKYGQTVTVFISLECKDVCPWCFRGPRLFRGEHYPHDKVADLERTIDWIEKEEGITNVLLTGGDALMAPNLLDWIEAMDRIDHVKVIRIGTRLPVHDPHSLGILEKIRLHHKRLTVVTHPVSANELKDELKRYTRTINATFLAQTPLLKGLNDSPSKLVSLWRRCILLGLSPYYVFHCRPVKGNEEFVMTLGHGYDVFQEAQNRCSGTAKRARYVMSCDIGKLEIVGRENSDIVLKVHQARESKDLGRIIKHPASSKWYNG